MESWKIAVNAALCVSAIISAGCWAMSAVAHVPPKPKGTFIVWTDEAGRQTDVSATVEKQAKWNKVAAAFASLAALLQAALVVLP